MSENAFDSSERRLKVETNGQELCRVCLDLTLYLPNAPTAVDVRTAWDIYKSACPSDQLRWVKTTKMYLWDEHVDLTQKDSLEPFLVEQDKRLDHGVMIRSKPNEEDWVFIIRGVFPKDLRVERCASLCRVILPINTEPSKVLEMAVRLAESLEFVSGHAGYSTTYDSFRKAAAFDQIYIWSKRFYGVDVEDLNHTLPLVLDSIKGAGWLTLISNEFLDRIQSTEEDKSLFHNPISLFRQKHGVVICAGSRPVLGDRNRHEFPTAYAEVENALWPLKLQDHPEFSGRFEEEGATMAWFRRLKEPENW